MSSPKDATMTLPTDAVKDPSAAAKRRPLFARIVTDRVGLASLIVLASVLVGVCYIIATPIYFSAFRPSVSAAASGSTATLNLLEDEADIMVWDNKTSGDCSQNVDLTVRARAIQFTPASSNLKFTVEMLATGSLVDSTTVIRLAPVGNRSLVLEIGNTKKTYSTGDRAFDTFEVSVVANPDGPYSTHAYYPFDKYLSEIDLEVTLVKSDAVTMPVATCFMVIGALQSGDLSAVAGEDNKTFATWFGSIDKKGELGLSSLFIVNFSVYRSGTIKGFAIWINIVMWLLGSCMFGMVIDHVYLRPRDPLVPILGVATGLLFALPPLRNSQPDVPPVGSAADALCFFWAQSMTALAAVTLMCYIVAAYKPK
jgi:hypothetical protein